MLKALRSVLGKYLENDCAGLRSCLSRSKSVFSDGNICFFDKQSENSVCYKRKLKQDVLIGFHKITK